MDNKLPFGWGWNVFERHQDFVEWAAQPISPNGILRLAVVRDVDGHFGPRNLVWWALVNLQGNVVRYSTGAFYDDIARERGYPDAVFHARAMAARVSDEYAERAGLVPPASR